MGDQEINDTNDHDQLNLTKTKAKKSVLLFVDKNKKTSILKEIKKLFTF
jgi:hypothetical protein